jgi:hypothetical protein
MDALAAATPEQVRDGLAPMVDGYAAWLDGEAAKAAALPAHLRELGEEVVEEARRTQQRLAAGLAHVVSDPEAFACFRFVNEVMRDQRVHSQISAGRSSDPNLSFDEARRQVEAAELERPSSWRPFQLAFILMQLPALTDPTAAARSGELSRVELLFFPTGGGKTEAYLGLAAYTFAIRRRQGVVASADGPLDGRDGVGVLMRYTLRLLTAQQFQRATALACAAELARRRDEATWGGEPFRIGLWVGTDVSPKRWEEANEQLQKANAYGGHRLTVLQVQRCPWCGSPIGAGNVRADKATRRVFVHCGDDLGRCPFAKGGQVGEGLPVLTVDEEIYRMPPAFVIATVDKFARLAREGEAASLFGYVGRRCGRHDYVHPDYAGCDIKTGHNAEAGLPAATVRPVARLRPPDLIIQDELHLITGALGTSVGLFEVAVETLASWETADGTPVRPMIVASTATVRRADDQVRGLYGRRVEIFPPQVLDVADTYFSTEVPIEPDSPGRRYLGVSAQGVRLSSAEIRVAEALLLAGQLLFDRSGAAADPYTARSWTCRSSRSCPPGWTTGSRSGGAGPPCLRSKSRGCSRSCSCTSVHACSNSGRSPGSPRPARCPRKAPTSAFQRGSSRSGSAAPVATTWVRSRASATPTPIRSARTWPPSSTPAARAAPPRPAGRARPGAAPPCPPATCSPARTGTSTSSRTRCGCTAANRARPRPSLT